MNALEASLAEYLAIRRALGFKLDRTEVLLRQFVGYLEERGQQRITVQDVVSWATVPGARDLYRYQRLMAVDNDARLGNLRRLRDLKRSHGGEIRLFCAHDAKEFEALSTPIAEPSSLNAAPVRQHA